MKDFEDSVKKLVVNVHCHDLEIASTFVSHLEGHNQRKTSDDFKNIVREKVIVSVTCTCVTDVLLILPFYKSSISERFDIPFDRCELTSYYRTARIDVIVEFRDLRSSVLFYQAVSQLRSASEFASRTGEVTTDGYGVSVIFYDWDAFYNIDQILLSVESACMSHSDNKSFKEDADTDRTLFITSIVAILVIIGFVVLVA